IARPPVNFSCPSVNVADDSALAGLLGSLGAPVIDPVPLAIPARVPLDQRLAALVVGSDDLGRSLGPVGHSGLPLGDALQRDDVGLGVEHHRGHQVLDELAVLEGEAVVDDLLVDLAVDQEEGDESIAEHRPYSVIRLRTPRRASRSTVTIVWTRKG